MKREAWTYLDGDTVVSFTSVNNEDMRDIERLYRGIGTVERGTEYGAGAPLMTVYGPGWRRRYEVEYE
jgi:hypothetical protein